MVGEGEGENSMVELRAGQEVLGMSTWRRPPRD